MASYIGKVQIGSGDPVLVGSTLYGICTTTAGTAAKTVNSTDDSSGNYINANYDNLIRGSTIHVKFTNGNTVTSGVTLAVGTTLAKDVVGIKECSAGTILSFTLDETEKWVANDNIDTNTEYVFKTAYNASTNRVLGEADVGAAAEKGIVTDIANNTTSTDLPTSAAVATYVQSLTGGLNGLTGAMHFRGQATVAIADGSNTDPSISGYDFTQVQPGDVVLWGQQEYVWTGSIWELLGDEGSYALKTSTDTITEVSSFTAPSLTVTPTDTSKVTVTDGSAASLTTNNVQIPNVTAAGSATTASVSAGVLNITIGAAPTIAATPITVKEVGVFTANTPTAVVAQTVSIGSASDWNAGALNTNDTTVVVP